MKARNIDCSVCGGDVSAAGDVIVSELIECGECGTEYEVTNLAPLAVVEAKRTKVDARAGKRQAELYADCLEKLLGRLEEG